MAVNNLEAIGTAANYLLASTSEEESAIAEAAILSEKIG
jgi:hypothetical protein